MAIAALGVVGTMGALTTMVSGAPAMTGGISVIADTTTPPSTPATGSAAPTSKASKFQGGDWNGQ